MIVCGIVVLTITKRNCWPLYSLTRHLSATTTVKATTTGKFDGYWIDYEFPDTLNYF